MGEIVSREDLLSRVADARQSRRTLAFANGCFDLLHVGHVRYLAAAAREADLLIVAINDDSLETHEAFARKYDLPFPLASDADRRVCHAYGVLLDLFKARRALVLVGEDGRVWWRHAELRVFHRKAQELREIIEELRQER